jgi:autophagy-related protein 9
MLNSFYSNKRIDTFVWLIITVLVIFWLFRLIKAIYNVARYIEIRSFYATALNIQTKDLTNITWHEVQEKLLQTQRKHHLCVHKQELTELDIYNRILRFKNYEVAMVNQGLLPPKIDVPVIGQLILLTTGFKYNFEFLFFWGPFAPFTNCYQLRSEFKVYSKRDDLTAEYRTTSFFIFSLAKFKLSSCSINCVSHFHSYL